MNDNEPLSNKATNDEVTQAQKDLNTIRHIINTEALAIEDVRRKQEARKFVSEVVSEALNDRQQSDSSVSKILLPIVEQSIEKSISIQRGKLTDFLYPLVGDLVRKFANAFVREFIEKTNAIIETSLSFKSMTWRYRAWRSGIPFARYVASQVYVYQVQQVLLIHKDTGILLNSVSSQMEHQENSDLVSAMLSAITEFMNDSFAHNKLLNPNADLFDKTRQDVYGLDEIRTNEFILYVKRGAHAILVAAVTGNISPLAKNKLQATLEQIHVMYLPQLQAFNGDTTVFATTSVDLSDCLLAEEKSARATTKKPWFAIAFFILAISAISYYFFLSWQTSQLAKEINALPIDQGIIITKNEIVGQQQIALTLLRDPDAISVKEWMAQGNINKQQASDWISVSQIPFISLSDELIKRRITAFVERFVKTNNSNHEANKTITNLAYDPETNLISGLLSPTQQIVFTAQLSEIVGIDGVIPQMNIDISESTQRDNIVSQRALTLLSGNISQLQIEFAIASAQINEQQAAQLKTVANTFMQLKTFANELNLSAKLLILGASDNLGSLQVNQALSIKRAENTADALISLGIPSTDIMTSGLGIIEDAPPDTNVRKAIIHVILTKQ